MNIIAEEVKQFRYAPVLQALIPIEEKMGIPFYMDENTLFLPFYSSVGDEYALASILFMEYPAFQIVKFEKIRKGNRISMDKEAVLRWKQEAIKAGFQYDMDIIPQCVKHIYLRAKEEFDSDKCEDCI